MDLAEEEKILQVSLKLVFGDDPTLGRETRTKGMWVECLQKGDGKANAGCRGI
jgi:hypothetical protein